MGVRVEPFAEEHLEEVVALLAARHRRERDREPALPPVEQFARVRELAARLLAEEWGRAGVVALRAGRVVGYMLGYCQLLSPHAWWTPFSHPRSGIVPYEGHAADPEDGYEIYRAMYAALAPFWNRYGCFAHHIEVGVGNQVAVEACFSLGFGQDITLAVRESGPLPGTTTVENVEVRRVGPEAIEEIWALARQVAFHHADSPIFLPYLPETEAESRRRQEELLAEPENTHWLAYREGKPIALHTFHAAQLGELATPEQAIYLFQGYTDPGERGKGIGRLLLDRTMEWARAEGYRWCTLHYMAMNLSGARFWQRAGFRPLVYRLKRHVDERAAWADSSPERRPPA